MSSLSSSNNDNTAGTTTTEFNGLNEILFASSEYGFVDGIKFAIQNGANTNAKDLHYRYSNCNGFTALIKASWKGHTKVVQTLLQYEEINVNIQDGKTKSTALIQASRGGHDQIVELLLGQKKECNCIDINISHFGRTALYIAAIDGNKKITKLLLKEESIIITDFEDLMGRTFLLVAIEKGWDDIVQLILNIRKTMIKNEVYDFININHRNRFGQTPLHKAIYDGRDNIVELLLNETDIDVNISEQFGLQTHYERDYNLFTLAALRGHEKVVKLLLSQKKKCKINVNIQTNNGYTALICAATKGYDKIVQLLLEEDGIDLTMQLYTGDTALITAAEQGHYKIVKQLLLAAENNNNNNNNTLRNSINIRNRSGYTALHVAAERGYNSIVKLLLEKGNGSIDVNKQTYNMGCTALIQAACNGHENIVKLLLQKDATNIFIKDRFNRTAYTLARDKGYDEIVELLRGNKSPLVFRFCHFFSNFSRHYY